MGRADKPANDAKKDAAAAPATDAKKDAKKGGKK